MISRVSIVLIFEIRISMYVNRTFCILGNWIRFQANQIVSITVKTLSNSNRDIKREKASQIIDSGYQSSMNIDFQYRSIEIDKEKNGEFD